MYLLDRWLRWFGRYTFVAFAAFIACAMLTGCTYGGWTLSGLASGSYDSANMHADIDASRSTRNAVDVITTFTAKNGKVPDVEAKLERPAPNTAVLRVRGALQ